jgi:hypothetical protein
MVELGESAAAGGSPFYGKLGRPHYWDNQANYLVTYSQAGSVDFKAKHDQYWGSTWAKMSNPNNREYKSFTAFTSAWRGFLQAHDDAIRKPSSGVLAIAERPIAHNSGGFDTNPVSQPYNVGRDLVWLNYTCDGAAFPIDDAFNLGDYHTIVYSPFEAPKGFATKLAAWLTSGSRHTLITHSFVPTRFSAPSPAPQNATEQIQAGGQEKLLGFSRITQTKVSSGIVEAADPILARALAAFIGKPINLPSNLYDAPGGKVLASIDGRPLVSEHRIGNSGRVIYLHFCPQEDERWDGFPRTSPVYEADDYAGFERALMDGIMRHAGEKPAAITPANVTALKYATAGKRTVFVTYNAAANTSVSYGGETFKVYQAQDPSSTGIALLSVGQPNHTFELTDLVTGEKWTAKSDGSGYVSVSLHGWNMRGIYVDAK